MPEMGRRWSLLVHQGRASFAGSKMDEGERIEVMPVAEHEAIVAELKEQVHTYGRRCDQLFERAEKAEKQAAMAIAEINRLTGAVPR